MSRSTGEHRDVAHDNAAAVALTLVSLVCWARACTQMYPRHHGDLDLWAQPVPEFWFALLACVTAFVFAIRARHFRWYVVLFTLLAVIVVLCATPSVIGGTAGMDASLRHLGDGNHLSAPGRLQAEIAAYSGPTASSLVLGMLLEASGAPEVLVLARWAPVAITIAFLAPVLLIARAITARRRVQWLTAGIFVTVGWTGQDYVSAQTFSFGVMLCVVAVVMTVVRRRDDPNDPGPSAQLAPRRFNDREPRPGVADEGLRVVLSRAQWGTVHVLIVIAVFAIAASDPLVGVLAVLILLGLWLVGRSPHWWAWVAAAAALTVWLLVPAWSTMPGQPGHLLARQDVRPVSLGAHTPLGAEYGQLSGAWIVKTAVVSLSAGIGALLLVVRRRRIDVVVVLVAVPLLVALVPSYGQVSLSTAFQLSLPPVAFLVAMSLCELAHGRAWRGVVLVLVIGTLATMTVLTGYTNQRYATSSSAALGSNNQSNIRDRDVLRADQEDARPAPDAAGPQGPARGRVDRAETGIAR